MLAAAGHSDGDGQYFHYLTKWAFALNQVAAATGEAKYLRWARELMQTAHRAFVYQVMQTVGDSGSLIRLAGRPE